MKINVKPAPGLRVVDPVTRQPLPAKGDEVERSVYWLRRLREGDVTEIKTTPAPSVSPAVKSAVKPK